MTMIPTECIICGVKDKTGLKFNNLYGEPFICDRCLFIRLLSSRPDKVKKYIESLNPRDSESPLLAHENIWKEGI